VDNPLAIANDAPSNLHGLTLRLETNRIELGDEEKPRSTHRW
jgi:hypothetical protein